MNRLDGKVVRVTGVARGIGFSAAGLLAQGGATVMQTGVLDAGSKIATGLYKK